MLEPIHVAIYFVTTKVVKVYQPLGVVLVCVVSNGVASSLLVLKKGVAVLIGSN